MLKPNSFYANNFFESYFLGSLASEEEGSAEGARTTGIISQSRRV